MKDTAYKKHWSEKKRFYGLKNPDKIFYICRRCEPYVGLFSHFIVYVNSVKVALDKGYIPIIDMQNNENLYLKKSEVGKVNAWEYYFKQPCGYNMNEIKDSRNVIWGSGFVGEMFPYMDIDYLLEKRGDFREYKNIVKKYFVLSESVQREVDKFYEEYLSEFKVLGVLCRGTDYVVNKPSKHPIQPTLEQLYEKMDAMIMEYECNKIFLATEDFSMYCSIKAYYGDKVVTNRKEFVKYSGEVSIGKTMQQQTKNVYREGMDYLVSMAILAKCKYFVGGHTSGTVGVMLMSEGFEYSHIFDLGVYK